MGSASDDSSSSSSDAFPAVAAPVDPAVTTSTLFTRTDANVSTPAACSTARVHEVTAAALATVQGEENWSTSTLTKEKKTLATNKIILRHVSGDDLWYQQMYLYSASPSLFLLHPYIFYSLRTSKLTMSLNFLHFFFLEIEPRLSLILSECKICMYHSAQIKRTIVNQRLI